MRNAQQHIKVSDNNTTVLVLFLKGAYRFGPSSLWWLTEVPTRVFIQFAKVWLMMSFQQALRWSRKQIQWIKRRVNIVVFELFCSLFHCEWEWDEGIDGYFQNCHSALGLNNMVKQSYWSCFDRCCDYDMILFLHPDFSLSSCGFGGGMHRFVYFAAYLAGSRCLF